MDERSEDKGTVHPEPSSDTVTSELRKLVASDAQRQRVEVELLGRAHRLHSKLSKALLHQVKAGTQIERIMSRQRRTLPREYLSKHPKIARLVGAEILASIIVRGLSKYANRAIEKWKKHTITMRKIAYIKRRKTFAANRMTMVISAMLRRRMRRRMRIWKEQAIKKRQALRRRRRRNATLTLQRVYRGMIGRRMFAFAKRNHSACKIQRAFRRYVIIRRYYSACTIQHFTRWFIRRRIAATVLQAALRGFKARKAYICVIESATRIESAYRGYAKRIVYLITLARVIQIQRAVKVHIHKRFDAAAFLERVYRGYMGRKKADARRRHLASIRINSIFRCLMARIFLFRHKEAAITIQSVARMYANRNAYVKFIRAERRKRKRSRIMHRIIPIEGKQYVVTVYDRGLGLDVHGRGGLLSTECTLEFIVYSPKTSKEEKFYLNLGDMLFLTKVRSHRSDTTIPQKALVIKRNKNEIVGAGSLLQSYMRLQAAKQKREPSPQVIAMQKPQALVKVMQQLFHACPTAGCQQALRISRSPVGGGLGRLTCVVAKRATFGSTFIVSVYSWLSTFNCIAYSPVSSITLRIDTSVSVLATFLLTTKSSDNVEKMTHPLRRTELAQWLLSKLKVTRQYTKRGGYKWKAALNYSHREDLAMTKIVRAWKTSRLVRARRIVIRKIWRKQWDASAHAFYYFNTSTNISQWGKPIGLGTEDLDDPPVDIWDEMIDELGNVYYFNAGTGQYSYINDVGAALVIQRFYRQRVDASQRRPNFKELIKSLKFVSRIEKAYESHPSRITSLLNMGLYQFTVTENYDLARSIISRAFSNFRFSPVVLYATIVIRLADPICPRKPAVSDCREWLEEAYRLDKQKKMFQLATDAFFKWAIVRKPNSWKAHMHYAIVLRWCGCGGEDASNQINARKHFARAVQLCGEDRNANYIDKQYRFGEEKHNVRRILKKKVLHSMVG